MHLCMRRQVKSTHLDSFHQLVYHLQHLEILSWSILDLSYFCFLKNTLEDFRSLTLETLASIKYRLHVKYQKTKVFSPKFLKLFILAVF